MCAIDTYLLLLPVCSRIKLAVCMAHLSRGHNEILNSNHGTSKSQKEAEIKPKRKNDVFMDCNFLVEVIAIHTRY